MHMRLIKMNNRPFWIKIFAIFSKERVVGANLSRNTSKKRNFVVTLALLALIFPESDEYLIRLRNYVHSVCEEYSWVVPAHCVNEADAYTVVDLFASETACMLAEIARLLGERLGSECVTLIGKECEKRVFEPYNRKNYGWESGWNNWTSVCCGNISTVISIIGKEKSTKKDYIAAGIAFAASVCIIF